MRIKTAVIATTSAATILLTACGNQTGAQSSGEPVDPSSSSSGAGKCLDVDIFQQRMVDYEPAKSLAEIVSRPQVSLIISGELENFEAWPSPRSEKSDDSDRYILMKVKVTKVLYGSWDSPLINDGSILLPVVQGGVNDVTGEPLMTAETLNAAAPPNVEMVSIVGAASEPLQSDLPTRTLAASSLQGTFVECDGQVVPIYDDQMPADISQLVSLDSLAGAIQEIRR